jgi:predicted ATPase
MVGTARDEAAPLLGRHEEQSLLTSLLDDVDTRGHALVLRGEPGIGKSRLLSECMCASIRISGSRHAPCGVTDP